MKKIEYIVLCMLVCIMILGVKSDFFAQTEDTEDPGYWKAQGYVDEGFYGAGISKTRAVSTPGRGGYTLRKGIDVSKWNGEIDWSKVKNDGVEFAIIRVGNRSTSTGDLLEDSRYKDNIEGALENDIKVGVYIYSQAITEQEAIDEANYILSRISNYDITLPVVIDYEYFSGNNGLAGRLYDAKLTKEEATAICSAFCDTVENAGYTGMIYANGSMLADQLNADELADKYRIWLAEWKTTATYVGTYDFWQYSSTGTVEGISGSVDLDYWYDDSKSFSNPYPSIFDAEYYANKYSDLKAAYGYNAEQLLNHFVTYGMNEGRQGIASFNVQSYKNLYADLRRAYGSDLRRYYMHYINYGQKEGRVATGYENQLVGATTQYNGIDYSLVYDANYYLNKNSDLLNAYGYDEDAAIAHFVNYGMREGRSAKETFNVRSYKNLYVDLRRAYGSDLRQYYMHYINYGQKEGRVVTGYENQLVGAITQYNGIDYSLVYDANYYLDKNSDLLNAYGYDEDAAIAHFVTFGMKEGRIAKETFNVKTYQSNYPDLQIAYGSDLRQYFMHYINYGQKEGRSGI